MDELVKELAAAIGRRDEMEVYGGVCRRAADRVSVRGRGRLVVSSATLEEDGTLRIRLDDDANDEFWCEIDIELF